MTALELQTAAQGSRFAQRIRRRYPSELALLRNGTPDRAAMQQVLESLCGGGADIGAAL